MSPTDKKERPFRGFWGGFEIFPSTQPWPLFSIAAALETETPTPKK